MNAASILKNPTWHQARTAAHQAADLCAEIKVELAKAIGLTLAFDLSSLHPLPPFNTAMMDGYAVKGDSPWKITGEVLAGNFTKEVSAGEAIVIATGAQAPDSADFVIKHEDVNVSGEFVVPKAGITPTMRQHIRPIGDEGDESEIVLPKGTRINPVTAGLAAACGWDEINVFSAPVVDFIVSGDELLSAGLPANGKIRDSLSLQIPKWIDSVDAITGSSYQIKDDLLETISTIKKCTGNLILTTGGTAAGNVDFMHQALNECGFELVIDQVAVRPGHPMFLAKNKNGQFLAGLPGNPLAAAVSFLTLAQPVIEKMQGRGLTKLSKGTLNSSAHTSKKEMRLFPVQVFNQEVSPQQFWGSMMLRGLATSTHIAVIEPDKGNAGESVELLALPWKV